MELLSALAKTDLTWTLEKSSRPYEPNPKHTEHTAKLTVIAAPGAEPVEMHFRCQQGYKPLSLEHMMAQLMKKHLKDHPVLREWLDSKGNVPVKLNLTDEDLQYIGQPMHTGLRKLADSKQSVITWNALHHMHSDDRVALWVAAADVVRKAFADGKTPTRRNLATALKERIIVVLEEQRYKEVTDERTNRPGKRSSQEEFAYRMFQAGVELTEMEEWMWGWLGYVVEDVTTEAQEPAEA
jgi:hypothetical protein